MIGQITWQCRQWVEEEVVSGVVKTSRREEELRNELRLRDIKCQILRLPSNLMMVL